MLRRSRTDELHHGRATNPNRVVVVDDDADACELVARIVEGAGWTVTRCHSHNDTVAELGRANPRYAAVVVGFAGTGNSSSLKLLDTIRHTDEIDDTPVLLLPRTDTNRMFAWQQGADGFLPRPFHADELVAELHAILGRDPEARAERRREQLEGSAEPEPAALPEE